MASLPVVEVSQHALQATHAFDELRGLGILLHLMVVVICGLVCCCAYHVRLGGAWKIGGCSFCRRTGGSYPATQLSHPHHAHHEHHRGAGERGDEEGCSEGNMA